MPKQIDVRSPEYLEDWEMFRDERSARDALAILKNEENASSLFEKRTEMLTSLQKKFSSPKEKKFFTFLEEETRRLNLTWSKKTKDFVFPEKGTILDVMCGTGWMGEVFYQYFSEQEKKPHLIYADLSKTMLDAMDSEAPTTKKFCIDVCDMKEIASNTINLVVCRYGFNNLAKENWKKAFDEVLRVLKPGGLFILQDHFVPGKTFSSFVNAYEYFITLLEDIDEKPFIFSTEELNNFIDKNPQVQSRYHTGHSIYPGQKDRLKIKSREGNKNFEDIWEKYKEFSTGLMPLLYHVLITENLPMYNVTYGIRKKG